ncbi:MAG TPA: hypothetical protein VLG37_05195 [Candidatus Saccharimonadales bacterium]|nr:hypothetical protein [Candidatus Saccharimonadales bacterium]
MSPKRTYFVLLGLTFLLIVGLAAGAYGFNVMLQSQSKQLISLELKSQSLDQAQLDLKKAKEDVKKYAELEKITKTIVPQDKDQAEAIREIVNIANQTGVQLSNFSFPASTLGSASGAAPVSAGSPTVATAKPSLSQLQPVPSIAGVYKLEITVQDKEDSPVTFNQLYNFLRQLERNRRTAQVSNVVIQPTSANRNYLTFRLTLEEYIKP